MKRRSYKQVKNRKADLVARTVEATERAKQAQPGGTDAAGDAPEVKKKVTRSQMTRRPTFDEWMASRQVSYDVAPKDRMPMYGLTRMKKDPILDTGAQVSVVNKYDKKYLTKLRKLNRPAVIRAAVGTTTVNEAGSL